MVEFIEEWLPAGVGSVCTCRPKGMKLVPLKELDGQCIFIREIGTHVKAYDPSGHDDDERSAYFVWESAVPFTDSKLCFTWLK